MKMQVTLALLITLILLLHGDLSRATSGKINGSYSACGGAGDDCLIANDLYAEFPLDSHFGRMLSDSPKVVTQDALKTGKANPDCPINKRIRDCLPPIKQGRPKQKCSVYTRGC